MVLILILHFLAGIALGAIFRIGIILVAIAVIVLEGLLGWFAQTGIAWYWVAVLCYISVQAGYAVTAVLRQSTKSTASPAKESQIRRLTNE